MQLSNSHIAQGTYTDLNRLHKLKVGEDRDSEANLRQVAQEFESLFISEMMKAMRSANDVLADDLFNSNESKTYRDMYDQQMSVTLSQGKGMGMADVLVRQMSNVQQPKPKPNPFGVELQSGAPADKADKADKPVETARVEKADKPEKYVHVADTTAIRFRRFTGIMPGKLAKKAAVEVSAAEAAAEAAARPAVAQKAKPAAQQLAAVRSYAEVKNSLPAGQARQGRFESPEEFVSVMLPMAEQAAQRLGVDAKYLVAQAALETGWGKHMQKDGSGVSSHNLFGIKSHGWKGKSGMSATTEFINGKEVRINDSFRRYDSFAQSFDDFVDFLQRNPRYQKALQSTANADQFVRELQRAGYATDPDYAAKISRIARTIEQQQPVLMAQGPSISERS
ncbi:MAG: flagellar assembly peptidoglycan hydrolase FlgJ [Gammaproteobacteria bacterium]|nr:flagellar assembly peptidoglycan hydrolase FlgJ [Gammaproteobacteria bacterium]